MSFEQQHSGEMVDQYAQLGASWGKQGFRGLRFVVDSLDVVPGLDCVNAVIENYAFEAGLVILGLQTERDILSTEQQVLLYEQQSVLESLMRSLLQRREAIKRI